MTGHMKVRKPVNVQLYGVDLPFVKTANHLGHQLSEECTMDQDIRCRKAEPWIVGGSLAYRNSLLRGMRWMCLQRMWVMWMLSSSLWWPASPPSSSEGSRPSPHSGASVRQQSEGELFIILVKDIYMFNISLNKPLNSPLFYWQLDKLAESNARLL